MAIDQKKGMLLLRKRVSGIIDAVESAFILSYFKRHGVKIGARPRIFGKKPIIKNQNSFRIGNDFQVNCEQYRTSFRIYASGRLLLGDNVYINEGVNIAVSERVEIGSHTLIGDCVCIYDTSFHEIGENESIKRAPVIIGRNVWLGRGSIILPGVAIGNHSVIAAGSVVTKSLPEKCLAGGNPAKVIKEINCSDNFRRGYDKEFV